MANISWANCVIFYHLAGYLCCVRGKMRWSTNIVSKLLCSLNKALWLAQWRCLCAIVWDVGIARLVDQYPCPVWSGIPGQYVAVKHKVCFIFNSNIWKSQLLRNLITEWQQKLNSGGLYVKMYIQTIAVLALIYGIVCHPPKPSPQSRAL